jgi:hypothetical protein
MFSRASERYGFRQQQTPPCLTALSTARRILADIPPPAEIPLFTADVVKLPATASTARQVLR